MSDLCFTRPQLARVLRQAETMDCMMDHVGVQRTTAMRKEGGAAWYEARTRCLACVAADHCRSWLADGSASPDCPVFCPNAAFFQSCRDSPPPP